MSIGSVGTLALRRNSDLIATRAKLPEADARAFAAALIPDPQIGFTFDRPLSNTPGLVNALSLSSQYDIRNFIVRGSAVRSARWQVTQTALDIDWQAWQTIQKARDLFIQVYFLDRKINLLQQEVNIFQADLTRRQNALATRDTTVDVVGLSLVALSDAEGQLRTARRQRVALRDQLAALLRVRPETRFTLAPLPQLAIPSRGHVEALVASVGDRRPDLLALRAGYASQDARVRGAILGQFPSFSVGVTRARDTGNLHTAGFGLTVSLPIFDGNRGNIAIERATRERLRAEYQARLDAAASDALAAYRALILIRGELSASRAILQQMRKITANGAAAYQRGDFPAFSYSSLLIAQYNRELADIDLQQALWQSANVLLTVIGGDKRASGPAAGAARPGNRARPPFEIPSF